MLKRILFIFIFIFSFNFLLKSQSGDAPSGSRVNFLHPPPTSADLGKFGDIPIGISTGAMQYSKALFELKTKTLHLPISIDYQANGLKVDQLASNVGMSWTLNAGGLITRSIIGGDDFFYPTAHVSPPRALEDRSSFDYPDQALINFLEDAAYYGSSQPDVYYFNFGEFSGKFVFDYSGNPVLIPYQNLKIELTNSSQGHSFTITTPQGIKYLFDKIEWSRYTRSGAYCQSNQINFETRKETSWYLSKITHPKGDTISLNYEQINYSYTASTDQTITKFNTIGSPCSDVTLSNVPTIATCDNIVVVEGLQIKEINNSNGIKVSFLNTDRTDIPGSKKVEIITVEDSDKIIKAFEFSYFTKDERMFLTSLQEIAPNSQPQKYTFGYSGINYLPNRLSFSQDRFGFYNGKSNSSGFFTPKVEGHHYFGTYYADRTSNGNVSIYGMLDTIGYPTGGKTVVKYESHKAQQRILKPIEIGFAYQEQVWGGTPNSPIYGENVKEFVFTTPAGSQSVIPTNFKVLVRNFGPDWPDPHNRVISYEIYNLHTGQPVSGRVKDIIGMPLPIIGTLQLFNQYSYFDNQIEYECDLNFNTQYRVRFTSMGNDVLTNIYVNGTYNTGGYNEVFQTVDYGGARVKSIADYDNSQIVKLKNFTYNSLDSLKKGVDAGSLRVINSFIDYQSLVNRLWCGAGTTFDCVYGDVGYDRLSSTYITNGLGGNHVYYNSVIEHEDDEFIKGGIEHKFIIANDELGRTIYDGELPQRIPSPLTNKGFMNGTEIYSCVFVKENGFYKKLEEKFIEYFVDEVNNAKDVRGYVVMKDLARCTDGTPHDLLFQYKVAVFDYISRWYYIKDVRNIVYNEDKQIEERISYEYDNPKHAFLSKTSRTKSDGAREVLSTLYPDDYASGTAFIDNMKINYLVGYPIEQVFYKELGVERYILSGTITKYLSDGKGLPDYVMNLEESIPLDLLFFKFSNRPVGHLPQGSVGASTFSNHSSYKIKLTYSSYDSYGNPQEVTENNAITTYLWGYSGQYPVAKIENATYSDVAGVLGQTTINSLSSPNVSDETITNAMKTLRGHTSMSNAAVTSYTYKPLVGMTSMTDPRGITEYYEYDGFQRLRDVLDFDKNLLRNYEYNYRVD